jgi:hypothetical protein
MLNQATLAKARSELGRLNNELHALHLEEERCKLKRSRLEGDKARLQALVDLGDLLVRLSDAPTAGTRFIVPNGRAGKEVSFRVEDCRGAKLIVAEKPPQPTRQRRPVKPPGLPSIADMIMTVFKQKGVPKEGLAPREIASVIRQAWWPDVKPRCIHGAAWGLAQKGKLENNGGRYRLNGHASE